jgi:hypothetical protein
VWPGTLIWVWIAFWNCYPDVLQSDGLLTTSCPHPSMTRAGSTLLTLNRDSINYSQSHYSDVVKQKTKTVPNYSTVTVAKAKRTHTLSWNRLSPPTTPFASPIGPPPSASASASAAVDAPLSTTASGARPSGAFSCWRWLRRRGTDEPSSGDGVLRKFLSFCSKTGT